jgi:hypothetical protein
VEVEANACHPFATILPNAPHLTVRAANDGSRFGNQDFLVNYSFTFTEHAPFCCIYLKILKMKHHLMVGTWTPPGAIFTFQFDDESLELSLLKKTPIPKDEPISWMTFDVRSEVINETRSLTL